MTKTVYLCETEDSLINGKSTGEKVDLERIAPSYEKITILTRPVAEGQVFEQILLNYVESTICFWQSNDIEWNLTLKELTSYKSQYINIKEVGRMAVEQRVVCSGKMLKIVEVENMPATTLSFPSHNMSSKKMTAQKFNYEIFLHVMADMVQKYAPEFLD